MGTTVAGQVPPKGPLERVAVLARRFRMIYCGLIDTHFNLVRYYRYYV